MTDKDENWKAAIHSVKTEFTALKEKVDFFITPELNTLKRKIYKVEALLTSYKALAEDAEYNSCKDTCKLEAATKCLNDVCIAIKGSPLCHNNPRLSPLFKSHAELQKQLDD